METDQCASCVRFRSIFLGVVGFANWTTLCFRRLLLVERNDSPVFFCFEAWLADSSSAVKMKTLVCICVLLHLALCKTNSDSIDKNIVNAKIERKIDISTHLVKTSTSITLENKGSSPVKSFLFALEPSLKNSVAFLGASVSIIRLYA